jgi:hypothetical protein
MIHLWLTTICDFQSFLALQFSGVKGWFYSGFDSAHYRNVDAKWHFPQENATSHDLQRATRESKPL